MLSLKWDININTTQGSEDITNEGMKKIYELEDGEESCKAPCSRHNMATVITTSLQLWLPAKISQQDQSIGGRTN